MPPRRSAATAATTSGLESPGHEHVTSILGPCPVRTLFGGGTAQGVFDGLVLGSTKTMAGEAKGGALGAMIEGGANFKLFAGK